jgi:hypothetical protein
MDESRGEGYDLPQSHHLAVLPLRLREDGGLTSLWVWLWPWPWLAAAAAAAALRLLEELEVWVWVW